MEAVGEPLAEIDLASEPDFPLGGVWVCPSVCRLRAGDREQRVEPRVMQVLVTLVRRQNQTVTRDQLVEACWGGRIVSDDAVNRVLAQVRGLARAFDPAPFLLETVPKVGVRFIPADGEASQYSAAAYASAGARRPPWPGRRILAAAVSAIAVGALGLLAWWTFGRTGAPAAGQNGRVEVMRFELRGGDPELGRLSADIGDAIIRTLTSAGIDTVPRIADHGDGRSPSTAELRITGSVDRQGPILVVDTQVLDRKSGLVLASAQSTRPAAAAPGFPVRIANDIAASLDCALEDRKQSRRALDPTVLALYLNTCDALTRESNMPRMLASAQRLVKAAPDLANAHAMYAIAQANLAGRWVHSPTEVAAFRSGARASAARALQLDPQNAKAYVAIANSYPRGANWAVRERNLRKARQLDPNLNPGRMSYIGLLREVGRLKEALEVNRQVLSSGDPRTRLGAETQAIDISARLGDMAQAQALLGQLERYDPDSARAVRWQVASSWEEPASALTHLRAIGPEGMNPRAFACARQFLGELPARLAAHEHGLPGACDELPPDRRFSMLAREGDVDGAYAELAKFSPSRSPPLSSFYDSAMKPFRADPRFMPLAKRLGLVDYWLQSGHWPDFCAEPGLPYDCRQAASALQPGEGLGRERPPISSVRGASQSSKDHAGGHDGD